MPSSVGPRPQMLTLSSIQGDVKNSDEEMALHTLPYDLLLNVVQYLDLKDLHSLQVVSFFLHFFKHPNSISGDRLANHSKISLLPDPFTVISPTTFFVAVEHSLSKAFSASPTSVPNSLYNPSLKLLNTNELGV